MGWKGEGGSDKPSGRSRPQQIPATQQNQMEAKSKEMEGQSVWPLREDLLGSGLGGWGRVVPVSLACRVMHRGCPGVRVLSPGLSPRSAPGQLATSSGLS